MSETRTMTAGALAKIAADMPQDELFEVTLKNVSDPVQLTPQQIAEIEEAKAYAHSPDAVFYTAEEMEKWARGLGKDR